MWQNETNAICVATANVTKVTVTIASVCYESFCQSFWYLCFLREEHTSKVVFTLEKFLCKNAHDSDANGT